MFEECFAMLDLDSVVEAAASILTIDIDDKDPEDIADILVAALELALQDNEPLKVYPLH